LIDPITQTFNREEIIKKIQKSKGEKFDSTVILVNIDNIVDINERYGISNADNLLKIFTYKLDEFFKNYNFKDIPIGRYSGGYFILAIKGRVKELKHLLIIFSKELKNIGINDIEIKIDFSLIDIKYDENVNNIIKKLFTMINENDEDISTNIKPNDFEKIVCDAIDQEKFIFKYQPSIELKTQKIKILEVLTKIYSKSDGMLSRTQIQKIVNHLGYETIFDKNILHSLEEELKNIDFKNILITIKISPVSLRNNEFRQYLNHLFYKNDLKPENFILEFIEKKSYEEVRRFKEILIQYKKMGFKICLDNFGGNNCSLKYIKELPIDMVKFDIQYTKNIDNPKYANILESYIKFLKQIDVKSMVKFIDKKDIYDKVEKFEPDYIQGFLVSKPKNLKQIGELLS
jgi:EAL domain-containing protein (putative c-di-GMP-specific phosphodiesterase class I)